MNMIESCLLLNLNEDSVDKKTKQEGVMIALYPPKEIADKLTIKGGVPSDEMHVTLVYMGNINDIPNHDELVDTVKAFAKGKDKITGKISGLGRFNGSGSSNNKDVLYASVDLPILPEFRQGLVEVLEENDFPVNKLHGYTPHMTITYFPSDSKLPIDRIDTQDVEFGSIFLVLGEKTIEVPLG
jgi:2'-5' RNA ligase